MNGEITVHYEEDKRVHFTSLARWDFFTDDKNALSLYQKVSDTDVIRYPVRGAAKPWDGHFVYVVNVDIKFKITTNGE